MMLTVCRVGVCRYETDIVYIRKGFEKGRSEDAVSNMIPEKIAFRVSVFMFNCCVDVKNYYRLQI